MLNQGSAKLYARARDRGGRGQLWSALTGRSRGLLALEEIERSGSVRVQSEAGIRCVPIDQICGSEGRSGDFDRDFNPLGAHNRERWLSGKGLPPVALIRVGEVYFVRDGHHRISVARALGELDIDARVVTWQVEGTRQECVTQERARVGLYERAIGNLRGLTRAAGAALSSPAVSRTGVEGG
jgi:hypothetical protein